MHRVLLLSDRNWKQGHQFINGLSLFYFFTSLNIPKKNIALLHFQIEKTHGIKQ